MKTEVQKTTNQIIKEYGKIAKADAKKKGKIKSTNNYDDIYNRVSELKKWEKNYEEVKNVIKSIKATLEKRKKSLESSAPKTRVKEMCDRSVSIILSSKLKMFEELFAKFEIFKRIKNGESNALSEVKFGDTAYAHMALTIANANGDVDVIYRVLVGKFLDNEAITAKFKTIQDLVVKLDDAYQKELKEIDSLFSTTE